MGHGKGHVINAAVNFQKLFAKNLFCKEKCIMFAAAFILYYAQ